MALTQVTAPDLEPITLAEAKAQARVETNVDDTLIESMITAAREHTESLLARSLIDTTWDYIIDCFPFDEALRPPRSPLSSVTSITYIDLNGTSQTWSSSSYKVDTDSEPGRIVPVFNEDYPTARSEINSVTIRFVAGYGSARASVPQKIRAAIKLLVAHWYENREAYLTDNLRETPEAYRALLGTSRVLSIF